MQPEGTSNSSLKTEEGRHAAEQKNKRLVTPTTPSQATGLGAIPADDCRRTWPSASGRTPRREGPQTEQEVVTVDKMRLPAVVRLSRIFWNDDHNGAAAVKHPFVTKKLTA